MRDILKKLVTGKISIDEAEKLLKILAVHEIGNIAKVDVSREFRKGIPEIVLAEGKTPRDVVDITLGMLKKKGLVMISRVKKEHIEAVTAAIPSNADLKIHEKAKIIVIKRKHSPIKKTGGKVGILTAGTSDVPVAEEARIVAEEMGCEVITAYDVGVAGIHRLFPPLKEMIEKDVGTIVVVAGREGALPSVVAGMVGIPIIAVPTSLGYGFGEKGVSALMAMLQACSLGLAVVNIDNGIAAGTMAALISNQSTKAKIMPQ